MSGPNSQQDKLRQLESIDPIIHSQGRLMVMTYLFVLESADYVFLTNITGMSWGNLSTHLSKLEEAGYVIIEKGYKGKKPYTQIRLSEKGREAFREYRRNMQQILGDLPE